MLSQHLETDHLIFERGGVGKFRIKKLCNPRRQKKRYLAYKKNQRECSKKKFPTRGKNTLCSTLTGKKISCLFACAKIFLQTNPKIKWCAPYSLKGRWILYIYIYIYIWRRKACRSNNKYQNSCYNVYHLLEAENLFTYKLALLISFSFSSGLILAELCFDSTIFPQRVTDLLLLSIINFHGSYQVPNYFVVCFKSKT